jgi:tetratricopeptide (TPR) repeat protein
LFKVIEKIIPAGNGGGSNNTGRKSIFQKFSEWMERNIADLEEKRKEELKRLLKLFDKDNDEALQYAIPLSSPYLNRGSQSSKSSILGRRPAKFDLGGLGGGGRVDAWEAGDYYNDLRTRYLRAAQKAIQEKDFRKAAYVYAHLLGDYNSAANVLEQGGHYREAAALYKDHLKNLAGAAQCLEKGGLHYEAIELYKELDSHEKVGDLYDAVNQHENAVTYYEKCVSTKITNNDYLDASRIMIHKLDQTPRAKELLLDGWKQTHMAEQCLKGYFDIALREEGNMPDKEIRNIYVKHSYKHKRVSFLNVLEYLNSQTKDEEAAETIQDIAYELIHQEAEEGNMTALSNLKRFVPSDQLVQSDTNRYVSGRKARPLFRNPRVFHLDQEIKWVKAVWHRNQFIVTGIKNGMLHIARGNWYGNLEYYSWTQSIKPNTRFQFINAPYYGDVILLRASDGLPVTRKNLPRNKYFNESLVVYCPIWIHKETDQCAINSRNEICLLQYSGDSLTLHQYHIDGELKKSIHCVVENDEYSFNQISPYYYLAYFDDYYYAYRDKNFFSISEEGVTKVFPFNTMIRFFSSSHSFSEFYLIVSTNSGCLLYKPKRGELNMLGGFFATELIPSGISFIATDRFVAWEKKKAYLFEISDDTPRLTKTFESQHTIIAVLPTNNRLQFAMIEERGKVTLCEIED